jgi:hypothetical protein
VLTWTIGDRLLVTIGARMIYAPPKRSSVLSHRNGRFGSVVNAIQHGQSTVLPYGLVVPDVDTGRLRRLRRPVPSTSNARLP